MQIAHKIFRRIASSPFSMGFQRDSQFNRSNLSASQSTEMEILKIEVTNTDVTNLHFTKWIGKTTFVQSFQILRSNHVHCQFSFRGILFFLRIVVCPRWSVCNIHEQLTTKFHLLSFNCLRSKYTLKQQPDYFDNIFFDKI